MIHSSRLLTVACLCLAGFHVGPTSADPAATASPPRLVRLRDIDPSIVQDMRYATANNFTGAVVPGYESGECRLLKSAAEALKRVQKDLRAKGLGLKVYDCFRPARAVEAFFAWSKTPPEPRTASYYPRTQKDRLFSEGYIARQSSHSKGTTIDLGLVAVGSAPPSGDQGGARSCIGPIAERVPDEGLDMGTGFDCFDPMSATASAGLSQEQRTNRDTLLAAMQKRGWRNYPLEWWHFEHIGASAKR
jgi:zinc D-Ala-D-Ala dipeptidase